MAVAHSDDESSTPKEGTPAQATSSSTAASRHAARRAAKAAAKAAKRGTAPVVPDALAETAVEAVHVYERNSRVLWMSIGAVALVSVIAIAVQAHFSKRATEAADQLLVGVTAARAAIVKAGDEPADGNEDEETFETTTARAEKAREGYAAVLAKFPSSNAASFAKLGEANALYELGKHAEAEKLYAQLTSAEDSFVAARALEGQAFALEAQSKHADAVKPLESLAKLANGAYKPLADYHHARMLVAQDKKKEAATLLEALIKAERGRPAGEGERFTSVVADAEGLLTELSVALGDPSLRKDIPPARGAGGTQGLMDSINLQLGGDGAQTISPEILEMLQKQLGGGGGKAPIQLMPSEPAPSQPAPSAPAAP